MGSPIRLLPNEEGPLKNDKSNGSKFTSHASAPAITQPGVIILNRVGKVIYLNLTAKTFLDTMQGEDGSALQNSIPPPSHHNVLPLASKIKRGSSLLPPLITELYSDFQKNRPAQDAELAYNGFPAPHPIFLKNNQICFARICLLQNASDTPEGAYLLILIEALPLTDHTPRVQSPHLTEREQAVVQFLFEGKTNKEVAVSMGISEHTVKEHIKRIMKKMNVTTRAGIVARFVQPLLRYPEKELRHSHR